ncbi:hypothetical protein [Kitasatospora sp. NPDC051164]|uniref:hypothetical protein n=1 Tax=Kitasatospora sp. NPDC051164 TaxID=3364055 RepID=UPI00379BF20C
MRFIYQGDGGRYYPSLSLAPTPGTTYELDADPGDGRWIPAADSGAWTSQVAIEPELAEVPAAEDHHDDTTGGE